MTKPPLLTPLISLTALVVSACASTRPPLNPERVPGGTGWHCFTRRAPAICQRRVAVCQALARKHETRCRPAAVAHCLNYQAAGTDHVTCLTGTADQCSTFGNVLASRPGVSHVTACLPSR